MKSEERIFSKSVDIETFTKEQALERRLRNNELDHWFLLGIFFIGLILIFIGQWQSADLNTKANERINQVATEICEAKYGTNYVFDGGKGCVLQMMR